jgi:hypothetical protein
MSEEDSCLSDIERGVCLRGLVQSQKEGSEVFVMTEMHRNFRNVPRLGSRMSISVLSLP